jgi:amidase
VKRLLGIALLALWLATTSPAAPVRAATVSGDPDCLRTVAGFDLQTATIPQLEDAMAGGSLTSQQLTKAYLDRIAAYDLGPLKINSIRALAKDAMAQAAAMDAERAAGHLRGPLHGIPVLLKDNIGTRDMPTTAGSIAFEKNIPKREANLVTQLRNAGALVLGKTNLSEFANWVDLRMPNGYSSLGGQVVNPFTGGDPSGSSSGSGAGGTMAFATAAFGTETSGSILSPSTANSMVGIKPTLGVVSRTGVIPLAHSYDTAGPMARNVTDAAWLLSFVSDDDPSDVVTMPAPGSSPPGHDYRPFLHTGTLRGARIGYSTTDVDGPFQKALDDLTALGATLVPTDTLGNGALVGLTELGGIFNEFKFGLNQYLANEAGPGLPISDMDELVLYNQQHPDKVKYGQTLIIASDAQSGLELDPPSTAARIATITNARLVIDKTLTDDDLDAYVGPDALYANVSAAAGYPTVAVPNGYVGPTPVGISILGTAYSEPKLIGFAYDFEQRSHRRSTPTIVNPKIIPAGLCITAAAPQPPTQVLARTGGTAWRVLLGTALVVVVLGARRGLRRETTSVFR